MKKIFYAHPDTIIAALTLVFLGSLAALFSWTSGDIYTSVHQALTFSSSQPSDAYNIDAAAALDLRGLTNGSSTGVAPTPAPVVVVAPPVVTIPTSSASAVVATTSAAVPGATTTASSTASASSTLKN